ncbi:MAG TPA: hypothetical protein VG435_15545 [Acidimicrobiales bacterium]|jgi:flagellar export protein FliJ|nr:hypothetical protein [Acidimicrobiales bacterium]
MKRYQFSLESALRARRAQEEVARQRLAEVNLRLQRARDAHAAAVQAYRAVTLSSSPLTRESFVAHRSRELLMAEAIERAHRLVAQVEVEASMMYTTWVDAGKQVASLERLDERRRGEWEIEVGRDEAAAVDDVVNSRWKLAGADRGML